MPRSACGGQWAFCESQFVLSTLDPGIKVQSPDMLGKHLYLLSHLTSHGVCLQSAALLNNNRTKNTFYTLEG